jgi:ferredoxin-NADP reductase
LPDDIESRTDHVVHVCAGSGSVPNYAILKYGLHHHPKVRHTFVYSNRTWDDVIFRSDLQRIATENPDRVRLLHTLTREPEPHRYGPDVRAGRISIDLLREAIPDPSACQVFACGPAITVWDRKVAREKGTTPAPRFLETVLEGLRSLGVKNEQITRESYG